MKTAVAACEVWVLRIVCSHADLDHSTNVRWNLSILEGLGTGRYVALSGDICEPVECYEVKPGDDLERAQNKASERAIAEHKRTGAVHKVVLSADVG